MTSKQKLIILLAVVLAVLIYFAPKLPSEKKQEANENSDYSSLIAEAKKNLSSEQRSVVDNLQSRASNEEAGNKKIALYDSLRKVWFDYQNPYMYAVYGQSIAEIDNTEPSWLNAADAFMKA